MLTLVTFSLSTMFLLGAQDGAKLSPPGAGKGDATAKLKDAAAKVASSGNYAYEQSVTIESSGGAGGAGGPPGGRRAEGGGGSAPIPPSVTTGKVEVGKSAELKSGEIVAFRTGAKLVYKKGDAWELYAPDTSGGGGGGGGRGEGGGGRGEAGGGGREGGGGRGEGGAPGGSRGSGRALMSLSSNPLPHELLNGIESKLKDVKANEVGGKWTFTATLTDAAADEISGAKRMREMFASRGGGAGGGGQQGGAGAGGETPPPPTGTATIVVGADGNIEQVVFETKSTTFGGEMKRKQSIALKDLGKTKVEVPADVAAKLTG